MPQLKGYERIKGETAGKESASPLVSIEFLGDTFLACSPLSLQPNVGMVGESTSVYHLFLIRTVQRSATPLILPCSTHTSFFAFIPFICMYRGSFRSIVTILRSDHPICSLTLTRGLMGTVLISFCRDKLSKRNYP